jgi:hypothetical protein
VSCTAFSRLIHSHTPYRDTHGNGVSRCRRVAHVNDAHSTDIPGSLPLLLPTSLVLCELKLDDRVGRIDARCRDAEQSNGHPKAHQAEAPYEHLPKLRQEKLLPFS